MIIVKLISGLGNQLFQYAIGRKIAIQRNVPLKLDISFYETQNLRSFRLDNYLIEAGIASEKDIKELLDKENNLSFKLYRRLKRYRGVTPLVLVKEEAWWGYQPTIADTYKDAYLDGYWQHHKYYEDLPDKIFHELLLKNSLRAETETIEQFIKSTKESISVHIRRGDYISDPEANTLFGTLPLTYYDQALSILCKKIQLPTIFVFSDDIEWAKQNVKWSYDTHFIEHTYSRQECQELYLMSLCKHNIIANSSFSWWGAFLNRNPEKTVISPKDWVKVKDINERIHIQMPEWLKI